jgi:hypothetical protein
MYRQYIANLRLYSSFTPKNICISLRIWKLVLFDEFLCAGWKVTATCQAIKLDFEM